MNKIFLNFLFIISTLAPINVGASCANLIKLHIQKKHGVEIKLLYGLQAKEFESKKFMELQSTLAQIRTKELSLERRSGVYDSELLHLLKTDHISNEMKKALVFIRETILDPNLFQIWSENLLKELIIETYASGDVAKIKALEEKSEISSQIIFEYLVESVKGSGFSSNIQDVYVAESNLTMMDFGKVLESGKLILDSTFEYSEHGQFSHLFQVSYIVFSMKKAGINPTIFFDLYKWMGRNEIYDVDDVNLFTSLTHGWTRLFDSLYFNDFTSPEFLNPLLRDYLNWTSDKIIIKAYR